jgi:hypothetical protein
MNLEPTQINVSEGRLRDLLAVGGETDYPDFKIQIDFKRVNAIELS